MPVLSYSPATILRQLLINLGLGTLPTSNGLWPIGANNEANEPDNTVTLYDTSGILDGRTQTDGEVLEHYGVQIRTRASDPTTGYAQASKINVALAEQVNFNSVSILSIVGAQSTFSVQSVSRKGGILSLGRETPTSKRHVFTVNVTVTLKQTS